MKNTFPIVFPQRRELDEDEIVRGAKCIRLDAFLQAQDMYLRYEELEKLAYSGLYNFDVQFFEDEEGEACVSVDIRLWSFSSSVYLYFDDMVDLDLGVFAGMMNYYGDRN